MKKLLSIFCAWIIVFTSLSFGTANAQAATKKKVDPCEKILKSMTLEEKVGQLFIVRPETLDPKYTKKQAGNTKKYAVTKINKNITKSLKKYKVGGIVMFAKNIKNPKQITKLNKELQKSAKRKLFICVDEEGGSVARIANNKNFKVKKYPDMQKIGKSGKASKAKDVGYTIGKYLKKYEFNLDFAPVADINTNKKNIVIGKRAFGSTPSLVSKMVDAEIKGFHKAKIMACVKHFPGHGDTKGDTHTGYVSIKKNWNALKKCEIVPFKKAFSSATDMVMVAHITANKVSKDKLPASLSYNMITKKLRKELKYNGVVITDSMEMGAVADNYTSAESAVMAIKAGADIVLMPYDFKAAYNAVLKAVKSGKISEKRLNESVLRILKLKKKYGLI